MQDSSVAFFKHLLAIPGAAPDEAAAARAWRTEAATFADRTHTAAYCRGAGVKPTAHPAFARPLVYSIAAPKTAIAKTITLAP